MPRITSQKTRQMLLVTGDPLDPAELPEKLQLFNEQGHPVSPGSWVRVEFVHLTSLLASEALYAGELALAPSIRIIKAETDRPARVRIYATEAQRLADEARKIGVDPDPGIDHGLLFELITAPDLLALTLSPTVDIASDDGVGTFHISVTNLDVTAEIVTTTLTYIRTE